MITDIGKKIISIKDIPSNIIEEAIFILKSDVNNVKNEKIRDKQKEIVRAEAEDFVKDYVIKIQEDTEAKKQEKYLKNVKIKAMLISIIAVISCLIIGKIFML